LFRIRGIPDGETSDLPAGPFKNQAAKVHQIPIPTT
jgi:hypothetical protein